MRRTAVVFALLLGLVACNNKDAKDKDKKTTVPAAQPGIDGYFKAATLPFQLSDTAMEKAKDTASIPPAAISMVLADSLRKQLGKTAPTYHPIARLRSGAENYYLVMARSGGKRAALLAVFGGDGAFLASYPFLLPDADPNTTQVSSIDKKLVVTKTISMRNGGGEGKEVVAYDAAQKAFSLIMLDALNENPAVVVSPIDTFPKTNRLAGDYWLNKKNLISIRDGRQPNQLLVYIHTENSEGDCKGELRGDFLLTSTTTASYRQGGDPCQLNLKFKGNSVAISEQSGCGNYRGLDCPLSGTFTRKSAASAKQPSAKPKRR